MSLNTHQVLISLRDSILHQLSWNVVCLGYDLHVILMEMNVLFFEGMLIMKKAIVYIYEFNDIGIT